MPWLFTPMVCASKILHLKKSTLVRSYLASGTVGARAATACIMPSPLSPLPPRLPPLFPRPPPLPPPPPPRRLPRRRPPPRVDPPATNSNDFERWNCCDSGATYHMSRRYLISDFCPPDDTQRVGGGRVMGYRRVRYIAPCSEA